jgi:hypothetical protein
LDLFLQLELAADGGPAKGFGVEVGIVAGLERIVGLTWVVDFDLSDGRERQPQKQHAYDQAADDGDRHVSP